MKKADFEEQLKKINLTRQDFCNLTGLAYSSVANWNDDKKPIPNWVKSWLENYKYKHIYNTLKDEVFKFEKDKNG